MLLPTTQGTFIKEIRIVIGSASSKYGVGSQSTQVLVSALTVLSEGTLGKTLSISDKLDSVVPMLASFLMLIFLPPASS